MPLCPFSHGILLVKMPREGNEKMAKWNLWQQRLWKEGLYWQFLPVENNKCVPLSILLARSLMLLCLHICSALYCFLSKPSPPWISVRDIPFADTYSSGNVTGISPPLPSRSLQKLNPISFGQLQVSQSISFLTEEDTFDNHAQL